MRRLKEQNLTKTCSVEKAKSFKLILDWTSAVSGGRGRSFKSRSESC